MCGIVGYLGENEAAPILLEALRRMAYRGYDSAGVATRENGVLRRRRAVGKLARLSDMLVRDPIRGFTGIGHTRWATHGPATLQNAHPHQAKSVALVHNGIVENFREIRDELSDHGILPTTDTDTETIVQLCQLNLDRGDSPREAAWNTVGRLQGAFALVFMFDGNETCLLAARQGSPLVVGHGQSEMFLASDVFALAGLTEQVTYLNDGDFVCVTRNDLELVDQSGQNVSRRSERVIINPTAASKDGHKHFMAKEIFEQPPVLASAIDKLSAAGQQAIPESMLRTLERANRVDLVGCGTASYACQVASYWFEEITGVAATSAVASEYVGQSKVFEAQSVGIFVSQSGETADTLNALRHAANGGCRTAAVLNVTNSTIGREAEDAVHIHAGVEIGVASTKAFTCQLVALAVLAAIVGLRRGHIDESRCDRIISELHKVPALASAALNANEGIKAIAQELSKFRSALFVGRGMMFPLALEGALKLKEISYIHAEGLAGGELKHGPLALVDDQMPVVVLAPRNEQFKKTLGGVEEVKARKGKILLISDYKGIKAAGEGNWRSIVMPTIDPILAPILYALPMQLLAYHTAVHLGTDVDQPRNLAKSVTVE